MSHASFMVDNPGMLHEFYDVDKKKVSDGPHSSVFKCTSKYTGVVRAVKTIPKARLVNLKRFNREIAIMKMMDHQNIIKLYETFEDHCNIYFVTEFCSGGELFDRVVETGNFTEVQAAVVMQQIFRGIFHLHEIKVIHRDLKTQNLLFDTKAPLEKSTLKIINFGFSREFVNGCLLHTKAGTPYYVAPEALAREYDQSADLWSCGVIMYILLCGYPPFNGVTDAEILSKVCSGNFAYEVADWENISGEAKNLINMLLQVNPEKRYTANQSLSHVWIKRYTAKQELSHIWMKTHAPEAKSVPLQSSLDNLKRFDITNKFKKAALLVVAGQLDESAISDLRDTFLELDEDGNGFLSVTEMWDVLSKAGLKDIPPDLQQIVAELERDQNFNALIHSYDMLQTVDTGCDGVFAAEMSKKGIDYTEFLDATLNKKFDMQEDGCWSAFREFDYKGDGKISVEDLDGLLSSGSVSIEHTSKSDISIKTLIDSARASSRPASPENQLALVDAKEDAKIDFSEFMTLMQTGAVQGNAKPYRTDNIRWCMGYIEV